MICDYQSGYNNPVDIEIDIQAGAYSGALQGNGVGGSLNLPSEVMKLPSGTYSLVYVGINWGGPYNFDIEFNGQPFKLENDNAKPLVGAIWNKGDLGITFTV